MLLQKPTTTAVIPTARAVSDCPPLKHTSSNSSGGPSPIPDTRLPTYSCLQQTTKLEEEPNPFEQSFSTDITEEAAAANSNNTTRPTLPPLAAIDSPTIHGSLFRKDELVWDSLRSGPLSPSMLTGPATADRRHNLTQGGAQPNQTQQRVSSNLVNEVVVAATFSNNPPLVDRAQRASLRNQDDDVNAAISVVQSPSSPVKPHRSSPTAENMHQEQPPTSRRRVLTNNDVDGEKRKNFLERNRQAAYKCRQRKKQWVQSLQAKVDYLTATNDDLQIQAAGLREQLLQLKTLVLEHKMCPVDPRAVMDAINRPIPDIIPRTPAAQFDPTEAIRYSSCSPEMGPF